MQESTTRTRLKTWFTLGLLLTVTLGTTFGVAQQVVRQSANDPQIQLAEDWADQLTSDNDATHLSMGNFIDPNRSLATFGIVYDQAGNIASSSVTAPTNFLQPDGVFGSVDQAPNKEVHFTWQPATGTRFAAVIKRVDAGGKTFYVLAARNLREVENRIDKIMWLTVGAWFAGLVLILLSLHLHLLPTLKQRFKSRS